MMKVGSVHARIDRQKAVWKLTTTAAESGKLALMAILVGMRLETVSKEAPWPLG
jgi:hypothetical protein